MTKEHRKGKNHRICARLWNLGRQTAQVKPVIQISSPYWSFFLAGLVSLSLSIFYLNNSHVCSIFIVNACKIIT